MRLDSSATGHCGFTKNRRHIYKSLQVRPENFPSNTSCYQDELSASDHQINVNQEVIPPPAFSEDQNQSESPIASTSQERNQSESPNSFQDQNQSESPIANTSQDRNQSESPNSFQDQNQSKSQKILSRPEQA